MTPPANKKRRRNTIPRSQNVVVDTRRLADDGLRWTEIRLYNDGLILREIIERDDDSKATKVLYSCTQPKCKSVWRAKADCTSTSNYRRHYKKFHKNIDIDDELEVVEEVEAIARRPRRTIIDFWSATTPGFSYKRAAGVPFDPDTFMRLLINFVISNSLALQIVESITFRQLLEYCLDEISFPSRRTFMITMLNYYKEAQESIRKMLQEHLATGGRLSLTCDVWTASNGESYFGITVHWIDTRWVMHSRLLDFPQMPPSHTALACVEALSTCAKRFGIDDYIMAITTDSHIVNDSMCEKYEIIAKKSAERGFSRPEPPPTLFKAADSHVRCMAHAINLSAQAILDALKSSAERDKQVLYDNTTFDKASFSSAIGKARRIIVRYRRSALMKAALYQQCVALKVKSLKLFIDMEVRWNSTYTMLYRFLKLEDPLRCILASKNARDYDIQHLALTATEWRYLKVLCEVFEYYYPITVKMSSQAYPTLYDILPQYIILRSQLRKTIRGQLDAESAFTKAVQAGIQKLDEYLDKSKLQTTAAIATILNPRMKLSKLRDLGWSLDELNRDRTAFLEAFNAYSAVFGGLEASIDSEDESDDELALDIDILCSPIKVAVAVKGSEADRYLDEPLMKKSKLQTYNEYWKGAASFYPILAKMARDYGAIMATSVPSEAAFSLAGLQVTKRRNKLAARTLGVILCLRSWGLLPDEKDDDVDNEEDSEEDGDVQKDWNYGGVDQQELLMDRQLDTQVELLE